MARQTSRVTFVINDLEKFYGFLGYVLGIELIITWIEMVEDFNF